MSNHALDQLKRETKDDERLYGCIKELYEQGVPFAELKALIPDIRRTREQLYIKRMLENNNEVLLSMFSKEMSFLLDAKERQQEEEFKKLTSSLPPAAILPEVCRGVWSHFQAEKINPACLDLQTLYTHPARPDVTGPATTVSLFGNNDLGLLFIFRILVIIFIPVNEHYHVRILLDGTGLS